MKWSIGTDPDTGKTSLWYIQSDTGHRVSKAESLRGITYSAWSASRKPNTPTLGVFNNLQDAQAACELDRQQQRRD